MKVLYEFWSKWTDGFEGLKTGDGPYDFRPGIPIPYCGNLREARVITCFLNPCWDETEHVWEDFYRDQLLKSLRGEDEELCMARGPSSYWTTKWRPVIGTDYDLLKYCAFVNLVPYHSVCFKPSPEIFKIESVRLMIDAMRTLSKDTTKLFIVCRQTKVWDLNGPNVINLSGVECRGVHFHKYVDLMRHYLGVQ
jgi:hypothetical protein